MDTLKTFSKFYYGFEVTTENLYLDFSEGGSEISAEVTVGSFTLEQMAAEVALALNTYGSLMYSATVDRDTRMMTITADGDFELYPVTGSHSTTTIAQLIGFTTDRSGDDTYTGDTVAGSEYLPQFRLQSYVPLEHWTGAALATVNKSASGRVEVVKFGNESFMQANITYITDTPQLDENIIRSNTDGVDDVLSFLNYAISKGPMEFMPDVDNPDLFYNLILESTTDSKDGVSFKLNEMYDKGLPGFYDTGVLKFRQVGI